MKNIQNEDYNYSRDKSQDMITAILRLRLFPLMKDYSSSSSGSPAPDQTPDRNNKQAEGK
jgi:hypothetical protein